MPGIVAVSTAVPSHRYSSDQLLEAGGCWLRDDHANLQLFERLLRSSRTEVRNFVVPIHEILAQNGSAKRAELFEEHGTALGEVSQRAVLQAAGMHPKQIDTLIFTSCSAPVIPSIDASLIERSGFSVTINRVPMYQQGCAGGVVGLSLASRLAAHRGEVMLTSVELCSLVFYPGDHSAGHLVGAAIFADGAASAIITSENSGLCYVGAQSQLLPGTRHLMGYDVLDDGAHLRLDRDLPAKLIEHVPDIVAEFLRLHGVTPEQIPFWLFHPGGTKILNFFDQTFQLKWEQSRFAREVLGSVGNLSSASVLFVLERFFQANVCRAGDYALMVGIGPGLTVELILFQASSDFPS